MGNRLDVEVIDVALRLQAEDEAAREQDAEQRAIQETAHELGLTPDQLSRARAVVEARTARAARRKQQMRTWLGAVAGLVIGLTGVGWAVAVTRAEPWSEHFVERSAWQLATSRSTLALLRFPPEPGAIVTVDYVAKDEDGEPDRWFVDLEGHGLPDIDGHDVLKIRLNGTLPHARIDLHASVDERWRSPLLDVHTLPTEHRLDLSSFEHQRLRGGKWRRTGSGDEPERIDQIVVKLGVDVNPPEMGWIRVDAISVE